jgi:hypothetical protein
MRQNPDKTPSGTRQEVRRIAESYQFFHWHLAFPDVFRPLDAIEKLDSQGWTGGFDVVLGNPPWVRQELLRPVKQLLRKFDTFSSTADSSVYFLELGVQTCRPHGRVAMLTPNKWFLANYADDLRELIRNRCRVDLVIDFGHSRTLFPDADTFPAAVVLEPVEKPMPDSAESRFVQAHDSDRARQPLSELVRSHAVLVPHGNLRKSRWQLEESGASALLDRLLGTGMNLEKYLGASILSGVKTGFNKAFYIPTAIRDELVENDPDCEPLIKRFLRGRDVKRWVTMWDEKWHIVIPSSQNRRWPWSAMGSAQAEAVFQDTYPGIHAYLKKFEDELRARQDKGEYWWELRPCDYYGDFEKNKLLVQCIAYYSQFAYDDEFFYVNNKVLVIPTGDLFLLAILNSRITWWIMNRTFQHMKDGGLSVDVQYLKRLPVPTVTDSMRAKFEEIARQCLDQSTAQEPGLSEKLEVHLDGLVEEAFEISEGERKVLLSSLPPRDPIQSLGAMA